MRTFGARLAMVFGFSAVLTMGFVACGGGGGTDNVDNEQKKDGGSTGDPSCGKAGREGTTKCTATTCSAGQYCENVNFSQCANGCTSDNNCAENEYCYRSKGETVGACTRCGAQPDPGNGDPGDPGDPEPDECKRDNFYDNFCTSDSNRPRAWNCPKESDPDLEGCVKSSGPFWVYCCPAS